MPGCARLSALLLLTTLFVGCSGTTPTVPNPFNSADRVPPPMMRSGAAGAPAYYPEATAPAYGAPAIGTAPSYGAAPPAYGTPSPYGAASPYASPSSPYGAASPYGSPPASPSTYAPAAPGPAAPAPGTATPYYGASTGRDPGPGDRIGVPGDSGSLRFATPEESYFARQETLPVARSGQALVATNSPAPRQAATANGWIAGSAPVRNTSIAGSPRVRMPGEGFDREPVSLAAINGLQGVPMAPLEPAPTGALPGEPAPLRVATPSTGTGWR